MKFKHYLITGVVIYLASLIYMTPAQLIVNQLTRDDKNIALSDINGTLWNGSAKSARFQKHQLDEITWSFSAWRLFTAEISFNINALYKKKPITTVIGTSLSDTIKVHDLTAAIDAYVFGQLIDLPVGELDGDIEISIQQASWSQNSVPSIRGTATWKRSAIIIAEKAELGELIIDLDEDDDSPIVATIKNTPVDLAINGNAIVSDEGDYELNITLKPTTNASVNLRNSLKMVAKPQPDGSYKILNKGDLTQLGMM